MKRKEILSYLIMVGLAVIGWFVGQHYSSDATQFVQTLSKVSGAVIGFIAYPIWIRAYFFVFAINKLL